MSKMLEGKVALVTGGSRGAGRGIALELGKAGATVYISGRSLRGATTCDFPGSIDETAEEIRLAGGSAIACRCDHTRDEETEALIGKIRQEQGGLDILVNNVWGLHEFETNMQPKPFWESPLQLWEAMFQRGVRAQIATNRYAIPLMLEKGTGLIVHTTFRDQDKYLGTFYYDLAKNAINRMVFGLAQDLAGTGITAVGVSPGWMRTELVLRVFQTDEDHWREVEALGRTESPHYVGRAVAALAGDRDVRRRNGQVLQAGELAREYGFTDVDGRLIPPFVV
ncbi:SDR family NAD(P)-dependent oxidoreductase [Cohnella sp. CFH 77786]|uniref:SDR family NAD(P)-dependent oxidoreductase n=1 Tax=Cohnella sp. CFH 77786 TaxID=2662265 RepID=UPI001C60AADC|nr:SDR family NAD(P)-dependent oxidoreductase [Cohnella sp. CFH 77786]MBW5446854.1 SDR family NAD(P)-dependent oxidoreductase [Cohnella sp. CFH 77786]